MVKIGIIGAGLSGLQLALQLRLKDRENRFEIHLFDARTYTNDKTWCYWEKGDGLWDKLCTHQWNKGRFITTEVDQSLEMNGYRYKMLEADNFYSHAQQILQSDHWHQVDVTDVSQANNLRLIIHTKQQSHSGFDYVFDSRLPEEFNIKNPKYLSLKQQFKGWFIRRKDGQFSPDEFYMMDYRLRYKDTTSFTYMLPISSDKALIEFTLFANDDISDKAYHDLLQTYIRDILHIKDFEIEREEQGMIPMSNFPFHTQAYLPRHIPIGTAAGWVKPSTGYSFKYTEKQCLHIVKQLIEGLTVQPLYSARHRYMDTLLLYRLLHDNANGHHLFGTLFSKRKAAQIFKFLDEESNLIQDITLASQFPPLPFFKAILKTL